MGSHAARPPLGRRVLRYLIPQWNWLWKTVIIVELALLIIVASGLLPDMGREQVPERSIPVPAPAVVAEVPADPNEPSGLSGVLITGGTPTGALDPAYVYSMSSATQPVGQVRNFIPPLVVVEEYQRATRIINEAAPKCRLDYRAVLALGAVKSRHGLVANRSYGDYYDVNGEALIVSPAIEALGFVPPVKDSDRGRIDGDKKRDVPTGPFQFYPRTWKSVGVDSDNDGTRNIQSLGDSSLAATVALCSLSKNLDRDARLRLAFRDLTGSSTFADTVMSVYDGYKTDSYTASLEAARVEEQSADPTGTVVPLTD